jgi:hypothetical protein
VSNVVLNQAAGSRAKGAVTRMGKEGLGSADAPSVRDEDRGDRLRPGGGMR